MHERLIEHWLDSASERSYQYPFCQMLCAEGHTIVHSTRHSQIEFGKDIITIDRRGEICAYQLKGNPGSRLTGRQFAQIQPQLHQLAATAIRVPGLPRKAHSSFLVTNGQIDEEAAHGLDALNETLLKTRTISQPIRVIARGQLIEMGVSLGSALWPSELDDVTALMEIIVTPGTYQYPLSKFHKLLCQLLLLMPNTTEKIPVPEIQRRVTSAAILTAVSLQPFEEKDNHFAAITAWTIYAAYSLSAYERRQIRCTKRRLSAIEVALAAVYDKLRLLRDEVVGRDFFLEGFVLIDSIFYKPRATLLAALLSVFWLWQQQNRASIEELDITEEALRRLGSEIVLWGEGAVPQFLAYFWYLRNSHADLEPEYFLIGLLNTVVHAANRKAGDNLPAPYFSIEDVVRHHLPPPLYEGDDPLGEERNPRASYFAESLLHLAVRCNWKQHCKGIWPEYSKIASLYFVPKRRWQFALWRAFEGENRTVLPPLTKDWGSLHEDALERGGKNIPPSLRNYPILLLLLIIMFPHRATPEVVRYLDAAITGSWMIPEPSAA